jgi:hypothetical protein
VLNTSSLPAAVAAEQLPAQLVQPVAAVLVATEALFLESLLEAGVRQNSQFQLHPVRHTP